MRQAILWLGGAVIVLRLVIIDGVFHPGATAAKVSAAELTPFKPDWKPGLQWVVETISRQDQVRLSLNLNPPKSAPVSWQFAITGVEKVGERDCHKVEIHCLLRDEQQPVSTIWVDQLQLTLRRVQTRLPVRGGFRTLIESYEFPLGQTAPVLAPLPALPLDLPLFSGPLPQVGAFRYNAIQGPGGPKARGEIAFAFDVEQQVRQTEPGEVERLIAEPFRKDLGKKMLVEVRLQGSDRSKVRQVWQHDLPWPAVSDNGSCVSRLVKVMWGQTPPSREPETKP
jgi:hypothetical protein